MKISFTSAVEAGLAFAFKFLTLAVLIFGFSQARAKSLTTEEKLSDLNQLVSRLKSGYGPLHYKNKNMGIDIDAIAAQYSKSISATKSNAEFYYQIMRFIAEFKDGHFSANIPSRHRAYLPFTADLVQGEILIDGVDRSKLPASVFPYEKGDQIVEFNGRPVQAEVDELALYVPNGYVGSVQRIAAMSLTSRRGMRMPVPSKKAIVIKIRKANSNVVDAINMDWIYEGQPIDEFETAARLPKFMAAPKTPIVSDYDQLSMASEMALLDVPNIENDFRCSGGTRTTVPNQATVIMKTPFVAYYFATPKGNIGYLRIPSYMAPNPVTGQQEFPLRFSQYEYAVKVLEENTVGLIIDQQHNCGGSVSFLHAIASLFMTQPFQPLQFELLANKEEYLNFKNSENPQLEHTVDYQNFMKVLKAIEAAYLKGDFMTGKLSLSGDVEFHPNLIHYTKPIVMMIDEMSGSGGDAFPALLQGHGRAKLIGTRTMGLGGHVVEQPALFYSQIQARITKSLFYRPDGVAVENNGAVPDVAYVPTKADFVNGYVDQLTFVTAELLKMVNAPSLPESP